MPEAPLMTLGLSEIGVNNIVALRAELDVVALRTSLGGRVGSRRSGDFQWLPLEGPALGPLISGGRVIVEHSAAGTLVAELSDRTLVTVVEAADAQVGAARVDGDRLVWVEAQNSVDGRRYWRERRLMTAVWIGDDPRLSPEMIAELGEGPMLSDVLVDGGWVVWGVSTAETLRNHAYRLSDGLRLVFDAPPGFVLSPPLYVHDDTLAVGVRKYPGSVDRTIWRIRLDP